jgi:hypothetical protein
LFVQIKVCGKTKTKQKNKKKQTLLQAGAKFAALA